MYQPKSFFYSLRYLAALLLCLNVLTHDARANEDDEDDFSPELINISDIDDEDSYVHAGSDGNIDDFEGLNRIIFSFNEALDALLFRPIAKVYEVILPSFARDSIRSALSNLHEPVYFVNHVLQCEPEKAGHNVARFLTNSTIGLLGLMDVAATADIKPAPTDFGLTLKKAGVATGPYLVLPILGPSSMRDAPALAVDALMDPWSYYQFHQFKHHQRIQNLVVITRYSLELVDKRQRLMKVLDQIDRTSLDKYSTIRSIYLQKR